MDTPTRVRVAGTNDSGFKVPDSKYTVNFTPVQTCDGLCRQGWFGYCNDPHEAVAMREEHYYTCNILGSYTIKAKGEIVLDRTLHIHAPIAFIGDGSEVRRGDNFKGNALIDLHLSGLTLTLGNCPPFPDGTWSECELDNRYESNKD